MNRWMIPRTTMHVAQAMLVIGALWMPGGPAWAQNKTDGRADKAFHAFAMDAKGVETDLKNVIFYWEEKISETSFVPHELKEVPVKRGTATVKIKFDSIKFIDLKPSGNGSLPNISITLADGKTGDFVLAIAGSFKGQSDFGEVELAASELKKLTFK
ncbi:MAG: hypothetical protein A4E19_09060 [Nitrospira sp. SG-bin1]|nr:MAG: hypothetical protein A4E19_09060 [Nitrospira sp. SG-bin1]